MARSQARYRAGLNSVTRMVGDVTGVYAFARRSVAGDWTASGGWAGASQNPQSRFGLPLWLFVVPLSIILYLTGYLPLPLVPKRVCFVCMR